MIQRDNGGPAFPQTIYTINNGIGSASAGVDYVGGMSLLDYFAAAALTGLSAGFSEEYREKLADGTYGGLVPAMAAYRLADALLKARTQGE